MKTKKCPSCNTVKAITEFAKRPDRPIGVQSSCKICQHHMAKERRIKNPELFRRYAWKADLKRHYHLTPQEYDAMFEKQGGKCLGCGKYQYELKRRLDVDHNHQTREVRGLLCRSCNLTLGYVQDNIETLESLIKYLKSFDSSQK